METKQCRQCGEVKPLAQYRNYYGGRQGTYTICRACEKINSRVKYIEKKQNRTVAEDEELNKIYQLYDAQRACGLRPPRREAGRHEKVTEDLDNLIQKYMAQANKAAEVAEVLDTTQTPAELMQWLSCELTKEPDYYLDEVYDELKEKYRPVLRIDKETLLPVYDETHAMVLDQILSRFNAYEDSYYNND